MSNELDSLLDHLVIIEGTGPNGSGGEVQHWKDGIEITGKAAIQSYVAVQVRQTLERLKASADMTSNAEAKANTYDVNILAEIAKLNERGAQHG